MAKKEPSEPHVKPADFVQGGEHKKDIVVRLSYSIIERFSEGLYSSPNKAFEELVSNSYDAGAVRVWLVIPDNLCSDSVIAVIDDGESMDLEGLDELWNIGVSNKRTAKYETEHERAPIGKFGIGKLATYVLCSQLTYICCREGKYLAVTMDYGKVEGHGKGVGDAPPMQLEAVELDRAEARASLEAAIGDNDVIGILFGKDAPESWTAALMSALREEGARLSRPMLNRILSSALPLNPSFKLWMNGTEIESSKASGELIWNWEVGIHDASDKKWSYADRVGTDDEGRPCVKLGEAGVVRGTAELYKFTLKKGKSEKWDRSHGFFVRVRNRVINLVDADFGVDVELNHATFTRFRMEVDADDLDQYLLSPREGVKDSPALKEIREYLLAVFNRARVALKDKDDSASEEILTPEERIASAPRALRDAPIKRILRRVLEEDEPTIREAMGLTSDEARSAAEALVASEDRAIEEIMTDNLGREGRMVQFDPERHALLLNLDHPFVNNYIDRADAVEPLKLFGATDFLTEIFMLDEDVAPALVEKIRSMRDEFLRALALTHPRSAGVVAEALRDAITLRNELEDAAADALTLLGFEVTRIGGNADADGLAEARLGARGAGEGSTDYVVAYDTKAIEKQESKRLSVTSARTSVLRVHREEKGADFTLLVAPGYQGQDMDDSLLSKVCANDHVTPIKVEDLARLVELAALRPINPHRLRPMFTKYTVAEVVNFIDEMAALEPSEPAMIMKILNIINQESKAEDAVSVDVIKTHLKLDLKREVPAQEVRDIVTGLHRLVPDWIWLQDDWVALNASVRAVIAELRKALADMSDEAAGDLGDALEAEGN
ncbi:MAG TPA: ATP-binding protein [Actinomycetota bacterium]|nr:ATP-binding protein [Actinomycetota bacterium]